MPALGAAEAQRSVASFTMEDSFIIPEHRDLTSEERRLLEWLLTNSPIDTTPFCRPGFADQSSCSLQVWLPDT
jgi:c-di-AMP phosphodiesterase-like protein